MAYATTYISHKRRSHFSLKAFFTSMHMDEGTMIVRIGIVCIALLGLLYVSETNALMFLQRTMPMKEHTLLEVKNDVKTLEIQATQLAASQTVQEEAFARAMVAPRNVSYVSGGDSAVAMAVPSAR